MEFLFSGLLVVLTLAPIILLIVLFVRTNSLSNRIRTLETRFGIDPEPPRVTPPQPPPAAKQKAPPLIKSQPPLAAPATQPRSSMEIEALIGGRLLNRIGAFALVLGVGFFLKYAFDNEWITETMRVLIGIVAGFLCLAGGYQTRTKGFAIFAQGLVGAGIAILYLSLYASFNFYHLIPQWLAFALMSAVTILTLSQAVYYDSLAVGVLGWAGGFLTPFLLSTGESNEIALFTYIALLSVGLLAITMKKDSWYALEPMTLVGFFTVFFSWFERFYLPEDFALTLFFLLVFWLLFHSADIVRSAYGPGRFTELRHVVQSFHAFLTYGALYILFYDAHRDLLGSVTFGFGIFYGISTLILQQLQGSWKGLETRYSLTIAALLLLGTGIEFSDVATIRLWAVEAFVLFVLGARFDRPHLYGASLVLYAVAVMGFLFADRSLVFEPIADFSLLSTPRALTGGIIAMALGAGTLTAARARQSAAKARPVLGIVFFLVVFVIVTAETNDLFRQQMYVLKNEHGGRAIGGEISALLNQRQLSVSGVWLLYSIIAMVTGIVRNAKGPRFFAIGLFGLSILKIFIVDLAFLDTLYRIISFIGLGLILLAVSYAYQRYKTTLFGTGSPN